MPNSEVYDVVIVGSGHAGAFLAHELGMKGKRVLVIEAGPTTHRNREDYMENFILSTFKSPESPYPPNANRLDPMHTNVPRPTIQALVFGWNNPAKSYLTYASASMPYAATYERVAGGTGNHWMGTSMRLHPNDLKLYSNYRQGRDWPLTYADLTKHYASAERFIGVSASVKDQIDSGTPYPEGYEFPMPGIPMSVLDQYFKLKVSGEPLTDEEYAIKKTVVTPTPAARNSVPYDNRRVCRGNTNCVPICPIQAKYDPTWAMGKALATGYVTLIDRCVVDRVNVDATNARITGVHYLTYDDITVPAKGGKTGEAIAVGKIYVLAAHAIENAKILLNSPWRAGVTAANTSDQVGRNLMDHPTYLAWGLLPETVRAFGYRGPFSTAGIESLRDGEFRRKRAAWRMEIGNEGWNWPQTEPYTTGLDFVYGLNRGQLNHDKEILFNKPFLQTLNGILTRQFRIAFLVEQEAESSNRIELSKTHTDNLGIPRPLISYQLSDYTKAGFRQARIATKEVMQRLGAKEYTHTDLSSGTSFIFENQPYNYGAAAHVSGTHVMGGRPVDSVVDKDQKSWDHPNLYIVGCGSMPSLGAQNPTLTMLAMASRTLDGILKVLTA